jgi:hypothetical protein
MALNSLERRIKSDAAYDRGTGLNFGWSNCQVKAGAFEPSLSPGIDSRAASMADLVGGDTHALRSIPEGT